MNNQKGLSVKSVVAIGIGAKDLLYFEIPKDGRIS